jgi:hypothetical protein
VPESEDVPQVNPGDIICRNCGTPNEKERKFCRMCGTPIAAMATPRFGRGGGRPGQPPNAYYDAGARPRIRAARRWPKYVIGLLGLALVAGLAIGPGRSWIATLKNTVTSKTAKPVPEVPSGFSASSQANNHPASLIADGVSNKYWAPSKGKAEGEYVEATFPHPFQLLDVIITPGASTDQAAFLKQGRPDVVDVTVTDNAGHVATKSVTLVDAAGPQKFAVSGANTVSVRLTIRSAYAMSATRYVGVAEVEFFGHS